MCPLVVKYEGDYNHFAMLKTMHSSGRVYSVIYRAKSDKLIEFVMYIYTMRQKKLHHFIFATTLSYLSLFE